MEAVIYSNAETANILERIRDDDPLLTEWERGLLANCRAKAPKDLTPKQKDAIGKLWDSLPGRRRPREWENL